jgi:hypothetical protein
VTGTVIQHSELSGPVIPLSTSAGTTVWSAISFTSNEAVCYSQTDCPPFVNCEWTDLALGAFKLATTEFMFAEVNPYPPKYIDVGCMLGLGPSSAIAAQSVMYLSRYGGQDVVLLLTEQDLVWGGFLVHRLAANEWKLRASIGFNDQQQKWNVEVVLAMESEDIVLPGELASAVAGTRKRAPSVVDGRLSLKCSDIGKRIMIDVEGGRIELPIKRFRPDTCTANSHEKCKCETNIVFHSIKNVILGRSILDEFNLVLFRAGVRFIPKGDVGYQFDRLVDLSPPVPRWYRLGATRPGYWEWNRVEDFQPNDFMFVRLSNQGMDIVTRGAGWRKGDAIPFPDEIYGSPVISIGATETVKMEYLLGHAITKLGVRNRGNGSVSVKFVLFAKRFLLQENGNDFEFVKYTGQRRSDEVAVEWPLNLESINGMLVLWWKREEGFESRKRLFIGNPHFVSLNEEGFVLRGSNDGTGDWIVTADEKKLAFRGPFRRFTLSSFDETGIDFAEVTGRALTNQAEFEVTESPVLERGTHQVVSLELRPLMGELAQSLSGSKVVWQGSPSLDIRERSFRIRPGKVAQFDYHVTFSGKVFVKIWFVPFPRRFSVSTDFVLDWTAPVLIPRVDWAHFSEGTFAIASFDKVGDGFELILSEVVLLRTPLGQYLMSCVGMWDGTPSVTFSDSGDLVIGNESDGRLYVITQEYHLSPGRRSSHDGSVVIRFTPFTRNLVDGHTALSLQFDPETRRGEEACPICLETFKPNEEISQTRGCNHRFHPVCLFRLLRSGQNTCPLCRRNL